MNFDSEQIHDLHDECKYYLNEDERLFREKDRSMRVIFEFRQK